MESSIQCYPKVCMVFQCRKIKLLWWFFGSTSFLFIQRKAIKSQIWTLFTRSKEIDQFLGGLYGKQHSVLSQGLYGSLVSVSQNKTLVKVWIFHPLAHWKEIQQFLGEGEMGKHDSVCPTFSWPFRVRKRKFFVKVFRSTLDPFCPVKRNWPTFEGLRWKAAFSVIPKFAWFFSVAK